MNGNRRNWRLVGRRATALLAACCLLTPRGLPAQEEGEATPATTATVARERPAQSDRVMMKDGSSFDVRRFEITESTVKMEGLNGHVWSIWSDLVDLEETRQANAMSSTDVRSPGWSRESEPVAEPREPNVVEPVVSEPTDVEPHPAGLKHSEPPPPEPILARAEPVDYEDAIARAKSEYEDAIRSITREQERLEQRVKELENALEETRRANAESEPIAEPRDPGAVEPLLEELAKTRTEYEEALAKAKAEYEQATRAAASQQEQLEQRIKELEVAQTANEDATRQIIRDATSTLGSKINQFVTLGGSFEFATGWIKDSSGQSETIMELGTAEIDFEVQANDWTLGSLILEYDNGTALFQSLRGLQTVDRINIDTAFITIGDPQRFPPFGSVGRLIVPFGISTGDPVADVLTLEDPLTIEAFEMRETAVVIGAGFPTPALTPATPPVVPPPVRPIAINPLFTSLSRGLGYNPPPTRPPAPTPVTPIPAPPPVSVGFVVFQGSTSAAIDGRFNYGATAGFVKKWDCGGPYDEGWNVLGCPVSIDVDIDYNSSVFDSRFLEFEYFDFLDQIGFVRGMASSVKATVGALSFVGEWNGALENATFVDGSGTLIDIKPKAWQVSFAFQFDWNPWVDAIGSQGSYLAFSYSRSEDLAGFTQDDERVGWVPWRRFSVSAGEWVMDSLRLAIDFSRNEDYPISLGGSGESADAILFVVTYAW